MPLELLFETLLCNKEFRNLQFSGVTFGKFCWGCAARTDQKKCLFPTLLQTWPLKSIPVFRPIEEGSQTRNKWAGINLFHHYFDQNALKKVSSNHFKFPILLFLCLALASSDIIVWYDFYSRCCDTLPFSLRPLHSMEIEYWFSQINSIFFMDHIS